MTESGVAGFVEAFIQEDANGIVETYERLKKEADFQKEYYDSFIDGIRENQRRWKGQPERDLKEHTFKLLSEMQIVLKEDTLAKVEIRQKLIDTMGEHVRQAIRVYENGEDESGDRKRKYFAMHLILDMLCVYCDEVYQIQAPAIFYDLMCRWNQKEEEKFQDFYGAEGEEEILRYTGENLKIISKGKEADLEKWLKRVCDKVQKPYVENFCGLLWQETSKKQKKTLKERKARRRRNICLIAATGIVLAALIIGIFYCVFRMKTEEQDRRIDQLILENQQLQEQCEKLQVELDQLKNDKTGSTRSSAEDTLKRDSQEQAGEPLVTPDKDADTDQEGIGYAVGDTYTVRELRYVRTSKSTENNANRIGEVYEGETVEVTEKIDADGWLGILYEGQNAYIKVQ